MGWEEKDLPHSEPGMGCSVGPGDVAGAGEGAQAGTGTRRNLEEQTDPGPRLWRAASVPVRRNKSLSTGWTAQQRPGSARDDGDLGTAEGPEVQDRLLGARLGGTPLPQPSSVLGPQTSTCPRLRLPSLIPSTPNLGPPFQAQSHQVVRQKLPEKAIQDEAAAEAGK